MALIIDWSIYQNPRIFMWFMIYLFGISIGFFAMQLIIQLFKKKWKERLEEKPEIRKVSYGGLCITGGVK